MSFLLDTCVISELTKEQPDQNVVAWYSDCPEDQLFISALTLGEIQYGIDLLETGKQQSDLLVWFEQICRAFRQTTVPVDQSISLRWGRECARLQKKGKLLPLIDGLLACSAIELNYILVTRNTNNFSDIDVPLLNPWR